MNEPRMRCFGAKTLRRRGWTRSMVARFLGEPNRTRGGDYFRHRYYRCDRVEQAEATEEWRKARDAADEMTAMLVATKRIVLPAKR